MHSTTKIGFYLIVSALLTFFGIQIAEALYPNYTSRNQAISDLGIIKSYTDMSPSALVFNAAIFLSGISILLATYFRLHHPNRFSTYLLGIYGIAVTLIGVFPSNISVIHSVSAFVAFVLGAINGILLSRPYNKVIQTICLALGATTLVSLAGFYVLEPILGTGGAERLVVYPTTAWLLILGGFLLNESTKKNNLKDPI